MPTRLIANISLKKKITLAIAIPLIGLIGFAGVQIVHKIQEVGQTRMLESMSSLAVKISNLVHEQQKERGASAVFIGSNGQKFRAELSSQREKTDEEKENLLTYIEQIDTQQFGHGLSSKLEGMTSALKQIDSIRARIDNSDISLKDSVVYYTTLNEKGLGTIAIMAGISNDATLANYMSGYINFLRSKEKAGIERAVGAGGFAAGEFKPAAWDKFKNLIAIQDSSIEQFLNYASTKQAEFYRNTMKGRSIEEVARMRRVASTHGRATTENAVAAMAEIDGGYWFTTITDKINILKKVEDKIATDILEQSSYIKAEAAQSMTLSLASALFASIFAIVFGYIVAKGILVPIAQTQESMSKLAAGDVQLDLPAAVGSDEISEMLNSLSDLKTSVEASVTLESALNAVSSNVMMANAENVITYVNPAVVEMMRAAQEDIRKDLPNFDVDKLVGTHIDDFHKNSKISTVDSLNDKHHAALSVGGRSLEFIANPVFAQNGSRLGTVVEWNDKTAEHAVSEEIAEIISAAGKGDLSNRITLEDKEGFFLNVSKGVNNMAEVMQNVANDLASNLQSLSQGDLTARITTQYEGIFGQLKDDYNTTSEQLSEIVGNIKQISVDVGTNSNEMADNSGGLSNRAEQQASTLEQTAASMEELTSTVKTNADNAKEANTAAINTRTVAEKGSQVANEAGVAMEKINDSSKKITEIINVIDEIAFQTNLLALNAAVEAARAGDAGRGFAVVAQEVRTLAQRSAQSSKDIKALIDDSSKQVGEGVDLVKTAVESLQEIYDSIEGVAGLVGQIASASTEQATSLDELNQAVMEMDSMTQENASMAQQSKITAEGMQNKSGELGEVVSFFQLDENAAQSSAPKAQATSKVIPLSTSASATPVAANSSDIHPKKIKTVGEQSADNDTDWQEF